MSNTISERIEKLRALMAEKRYDAVIVPTGDYHMSEYTGDYFGRDRRPAFRAALL